MTRMTPASITKLLDKRSDFTEGKPHVILVYEELSLFFGFMLESPDFMREFLFLTGGSELRENTKQSGLENIKSPRVNLLGFIQGYLICYFCTFAKLNSKLFLQLQLDLRLALIS